MLAMTILAEDHARKASANAFRVDVGDGIAPDDEVERLASHCEISHAVYDSKTIESRLETFNRRYPCLYGSSESQWNILNHTVAAKRNHPAHLLLERRGRTSDDRDIFIAIRGTKEMADVLTDALFTTRTLRNGFVHSGIAEAAEQLLERNFPLLRICSEANYNVNIVGHSLGGGVASVLAMLLRQELPHVDIRSSTFGTPPCMSPDLAASTSSYITSVVNAFDVISRASPQNLTRLIDEVHEYDWEREYRSRVEGIFATASPITSRVQITKNVVDSMQSQILSFADYVEPEDTADDDDDDDERRRPVIDDELVLPGRVVYLQTDHPHVIVLKDPQAYLNRILLVSTLISDHSALGYANALCRHAGLGGLK